MRNGLLLEHELGGFDNGSFGRHQISNNAQKSVSSSSIFLYATRRQNSGESFGNSRIGEKVPKKAQGKAKQVERISIFFGGGATTLSQWRKKRIDCTMRFTLMGLRGSQLLSDSLTLLGFPKYLLTRTSVSGMNNNNSLSFSFSPFH